MSLELVKKLRETTGAGMLDCQNALKESGGDMEKAVEVLRKKGLAAAAKKASRLAKEGLLGFGVSSDGSKQVLVEINCETDFVAKTDDFQKFLRSVTDVALSQNPADLQALLSLKMGRGTVQDCLTDLVAKLGENLQLRRFVAIKGNGNGDQLASYIHAGSKIGVIVHFSHAQKLDAGQAREIAMHVAAMHPKYVRAAEVSAAFLEKEKEIQLAQLKESGKPQQILDKIIDGKIRKTLSEICLEDQVFVKDPEGKKTVKDWIRGLAPEAQIQKFVRLEVGEEG